MALAAGITTAARFSICRTAKGHTYYRGLTPANGESVQVDHVVSTADGWSVVAPDGTTYAISPSGMTITLTSGTQVTARMLNYWNSAGQQAVPTTPVRRDANGFAVGGPPMPTSPSDYNHPSRAECLRFRTELRAWSNYQNQHRPAGSTGGLPMSGQVQYLSMFCHLNYF